MLSSFKGTLTQIEQCGKKGYSPREGQNFVHMTNSKVHMHSLFLILFS